MESTRLPKLSFPLFPFFLAVLLFPSILAAIDNLANPIRLVTDSGRPSLAHLLLNAEVHFHEFLRRFNKKYSRPEEHKRRFSIFKSNLLKAMHHQALNPTAIHGITKFSDLTEEEFSSMYLGLHQIPRDFSRLEQAPVLRTDDLPESFDWRERGAVTPIKDQVKIMPVTDKTYTFFPVTKIIVRSHVCSLSDFDSGKLWVLLEF